MAATLAAWWTFWDSTHVKEGMLARFSQLSITLGSPFAENVLFYTPPVISLGMALTLAYRTDATFLHLKWTVVNLCKLVFWRLMTFSVPLLMIASGFDDLLSGEIWGTVWIILAGVLAFFAGAGLRSAEGMRLHQVKASETRNRALAMARKMGVELRRIYVVPAGRGHLTNAFGGGASIGLTDNLGKYLNRNEIDFVTAHELAHVQQKHGRKRLLLNMGIFGVAGVVVFVLRGMLILFRPALDVLIIFMPLAITYAFSRSCEYEADHIAVKVTGDPESGITALARLNEASNAPYKTEK